MTRARLLVLILASPLIHHLKFELQGQHDLVRGFTVMVVGDLSESLLVIYCAKALLGAFRPAA